MQPIRTVLAVIGLWVSFGAMVRGAEPTAGDVVGEVVLAAEAFVDGLDASQRERLFFSFDDDAQRERWSNLPNGIFERRGLRTGELRDDQYDAAMRVLDAILSEKGSRQIRENIAGAEVLGQGGRDDIGKDHYYIAILGRPSRTEPWMWQFGAHHLGVNATVQGDSITLSPTLTGGQPVTFEHQGKRVRQLEGERAKALELMSALTETQRREAVVGSRYDDDMVYGPGAKRIAPGRDGIRADSLTGDQQILLLALIEERVGILNDTHAKIAMGKIETNLPWTYFSWSGPWDGSAPASFRIQGPTVLIEYAPQDKRGEHLHAVYRDPSRDYGVDAE